MGYQTVTIPFAEVPSALKLGTVDASSWVGPESLWTIFRDTCKYYYPIRDVYSTGQVIINKELFNSMSTEDQDIFR